MDYTDRGTLQARILEWVAFPFSRRSSQPRDRTRVSCIAGRFFFIWATRENQETYNIYQLNLFTLCGHSLWSPQTITVKVKVSQSCLTFCNPMDCPWNSTARIVEWVAFPFSRRSSQPRDKTQVSCFAGRFFTNWAIRKVLNNYSSNFEDHWSKDIMMKKFDILWELPKCDREMKWATAARKIVPIDLLNTGLPQISLL